VIQESNGVPGMIQASEDTATILRGFGKGSWLTPRDGKINAKGKGDLQTYFIKARVSRPSKVTASTRSDTASQVSDSEYDDAIKPPISLSKTSVSSDRSSQVPNSAE
jgi:hypothetical protein